MLRAFEERLPALDAARLLAGPVAEQCDPRAWGPAERAANGAHVTAGRDPALRDRLRSALLGDRGTGPRLCGLCTALGYERPPECD